MYTDRRDNSKLIWIIAGALITVALLLAVFFWLNSTSNNNQISEQLHNQTPVQEKTDTATPPVAQAIEQTAASSTDHIELLNESVLKDKVPENASLAKEEVAKLEDIQKQLDQQQHSLKSQHADADQLIKLKEEQIKLLEQQLAAQNK